jgi:peroxiredoxin Q/BCP
MKLTSATLLSSLVLAMGCAPQPGAASPAAGTAATNPASGPSTPTTESPAPPATSQSTVASASSAAPAASAGSTAAGASPTATSAAAASDDLVGKPAPDFTAPTQTGTTFHLAAAKGKTVIVYFYPKDETPGCTKEACAFRDSWNAIAKTGAVLVGVSADTTASHKEFAAHHKLPFLLVSDPDGAIAHEFAVPFEGHHKRQTIVIGPDGTVRKVYRTVDVSVHSSQILDDLGHSGSS